jgi:hypothetical protein
LQHTQIVRNVAELFQHHGVAIDAAIRIARATKGNRASVAVYSREYFRPQDRSPGAATLLSFARHNAVVRQDEWQSDVVRDLWHRKRSGSRWMIAPILLRDSGNLAGAFAILPGISLPPSRGLMGGFGRLSTRLLNLIACRMRQWPLVVQHRGKSRISNKPPHSSHRQK